MNCYDFDNTIYKGDSSTDFYKYCLAHYPRILRRFPGQLTAFLKFYVFHTISKTEMKEVFYRYFLDIPDMQKAVADFWEKNLRKVKPFYKELQKEDDVIISASPEFFLAPAMTSLNISHFMASPVDETTGKHFGLNCHGEEKVRRFYERFPEGEVDAFYSDSYSDTPMAKLAKRAYFVTGDNISDWKFN